MRRREDRERDKLIAKANRAKGRTEGLVAGAAGGGLLSIILTKILTEIFIKAQHNDTVSQIESQQNEQKSLEEHRKYGGLLYEKENRC